MSSGQFQADVVINGLFLAQNSSDNGERVRSLLYGREVLAMQSGMAELIKGGSDVRTDVKARSKGIQ